MSDVSFDYERVLFWANKRKAISWDAVMAARSWYIEQHETDDDYERWMLEQGIKHTTTSIAIVDEEKYTFFLLRWT